MIGPRLATADGALGFWKALREVYPGTREQTCWFHKSGNVLDKMPKSVQRKGKAMIREMWQAPGGQVSEGGRMPAQGRGVVVQLLRVSGGPLGTSADQHPARPAGDPPYGPRVTPRGNDPRKSGPPALG